MRQITNDLSDYRGIRLTADGRTIATRQTEWQDRFEVLSLAEPSRLEEHGPRGVWTFTWLDNSKILANQEGRSLKVVSLFKDDTTTLNVAKGHFFYFPSLCGPDTLVSIGGTLVGNTVSVYKMNLDGSGATQVTKGPLDNSPECTSDGRWLFYVDSFANHDPHRPLLMRLSLQGGTFRKLQTIHGCSTFLPMASCWPSLVTKDLPIFKSFRQIHCKSSRASRCLLTSKTLT